MFFNLLRQRIQVNAQNVIPLVIQKLGDGEEVSQMFCLERAVVLGEHTASEDGKFEAKPPLPEPILNHEPYRAIPVVNFSRQRLFDTQLKQPEKPTLPKTDFSGCFGIYHSGCKNKF